MLTRKISTLKTNPGLGRIFISLSLRGILGVALTACLVSDAPTQAVAPAAQFRSVAKLPAPCCSITSIDLGNSLVTARVSASGQTFQFAVTSATLLNSLRVGQRVYANFARKQVSLDGVNACCEIVSPGQAPRGGAPQIAQIGAGKAGGARPQMGGTAQIDPCTVASADTLKALLQAGIQGYFPLPVDNDGEHIRISDPNVEQVACPNMAIKVHFAFSYSQTQGFPQFQTGGGLEIQSPLVGVVTFTGGPTTASSVTASNLVRAVAVLTNPQITSLQVDNIPSWIDLTWVRDCLNGKYANLGCRDVLHVVSFDVTNLVRLYLEQGHTLPAAPTSGASASQPPSAGGGGKPAAGLAQQAPPPAPGSKANAACCAITSLNVRTGVVTAHVNSTGQTFQFAARNAALLNSLRIGQAVYGNFPRRQVSLDGRTICCNIIAMGAVPTRPGPPTPAPATGMAAKALAPFGLGRVRVGGLKQLPAFMNASGGDGIQAVNELMALPWVGLSDQFTKQGTQAILDLNGKTVASGYTDLPGNSTLSFNLWLQNVRPFVNISSSSPPGFQYASLTGVGGQSPGFVFQAPLNGQWGFGFSAGLRGKVDAYGQTLFDDTVPFSLGVPKFKITAGAQLDTTNPNRPSLVQAYVNPDLVLDVAGTEIPLNVTAKIEGGKLIFPARVTNLGFNFGGTGVSLTADLVLTIYPQQYQETVEGSISGPVIGTQGIHLSAAFQEATLELKGNFSLTVGVPDWAGGGSVGVQVPLDLSVPVAIPSTSEFNQAMMALQPPLPRSWPLVDGPPDSVPVDPSNLAATATFLEAGITPRHMPYGAILQVDRRQQYAAATAPLNPTGLQQISPGVAQLINPQKPGSTFQTVKGGVLLAPGCPVDPRAPETFGRLWDSSIWTGHYLAAESFRYASTNSPDALARIRQVINGIKQLFWVTGDAVVSNGQVYPVDPAGGLLTRSTLPADSPMPWWEGLPPRHEDGSIPCYYERPEGGWKLGKQTFATLHDASGGVRGGAPGGLARGPAGRSGRFGPQGGVSSAGNPEPQGRIWYGVGCGKVGEDPISRDQYDGIMMGLAYAYQLVPDPAVRNDVREIVDGVLDRLVTRDQWSLRLPPEGVISTSWLGEIDMQLDFLRIGATVDPARWGAIYQQLKPASAAAWLPEWFSVLDPVSSYYGRNLSHAVYSPTLFLEDDPQARQNYMRAYMILRSTTEKHRNAYFDLVRIAVELPQNRPPVAAAIGPEVSTLLSEWLQRLAKVKNPSNGFPTNKIPDPDAIRKAWTTLVREYTTLDGSPSFLTTYAFPLPKRTGDTDFMWEKDPFDTNLHPGGNDMCAASAGVPPTDDQLNCCSSSAWREASGVEFLLPYWMSVYLGVVPAPSTTPPAGSVQTGGAH